MKLIKSYNFDATRILIDEYLKLDVTSILIGEY